MRNFDTGATRDSDETKYDYEGFMHPLVLERFAEYMHKHRHQADGTLRAADNWQKGIPLDAYMQSMFRHFMDVWKHHRGYESEDLEESLSALMFNVMGYLYEALKDRGYQDPAFMEHDYDNIQRGAVLKIHVPDRGTDVLGFDLMQHSRIIDREEYKGPNFDAPDFPVENGDYDKGHDVTYPNTTHRYGALADDQEAIAAEAEDEQAEDSRKEAGWNITIKDETGTHTYAEWQAANRGWDNYHCAPGGEVPEGYTRDSYGRWQPNHPAIPQPDSALLSLPVMERSEVLGLRTQRPESEGTEVASEVRGVGPGEAEVHGTK